ncbi:MAG: ABC transporter ATP-binding protein [Candidatus Riflebacteria bacterium]|nr:ABC transporter ATP-binding protein [Candidatus Riflebacteria bacterium]
MAKSSEPLLKIENYSLILKGSDGLKLPVLNNVNLSVESGKTLGVAGESGSGKSVLALSIMGLIPEASLSSRKGRILFQEKNICDMSEESLRTIRGSGISIVFQEPMSAMNPLLTLYEQIAETVWAHRPDLSEKEVRQKVILALKQAGFADPESILCTYPHRLSGGMRQRAMLAMATVLDPPLILADEPTTALDASLQVQLLIELRKAVRERNHSLVFISHDLGVIKNIADYLAVLYAGTVVEYGPAEDVLNHPAHPYTNALVSSLPRLIKQKILPKPIPGHLPAPGNLPLGCVFSDRCPKSAEKCRQETPEESGAHNTGFVKCFFP